MKTPRIECNKCGACCEVGGACITRNWDRSGRPVEFTGRCELLVSHEDGTQTCRMMELMIEQGNSAALSRWVNGRCNFASLRREIVPLAGG